MHCWNLYTSCMPRKQDLDFIAMSMQALRHMLSLLNMHLPQLWKASPAVCSLPVLAQGGLLQRQQDRQGHAAGSQRRPAFKVAKSL